MYELLDEIKDVRAPVLIVSFSDWVDAGQAGTTAARRIADGGEVVARFDTDALFDYRAHRPVLDIVDGMPKQFAWPEMTVTRRRFDERDLFVLTGPEPDYRWKAFTHQVLELAQRIGVADYVSLGAIPAAIPHTAATPVMMTSSNPELRHGMPATEGLLRVPAAAVSAVEWTMAQSGIPSVGFWAQVPHYATPYAAGAIALVRKVETHLSVTIGAGSLEEEAGLQQKALQELLADNEEAQEYLQRLESMVDEEEVPSTEDIADEVEKFLRSQRRGESGQNPFSP